MRINDQEVKRIGRGEFSAAYRVVDSDIVYIATVTNDDSANDNTKEIYSHIDSKHVPYMSTVDTEVYMRGYGYVNLYESRYYMPLTAQHMQAWKEYKILSSAWEKISRENMHLIMKAEHGEYGMRHAVCELFIRYLEDNDLVSSELIRALDLIHTWASAYGSGFLFEFPKQNLRVDSEGNLILLDIVFFRKPERNRW